MTRLEAEWKSGLQGRMERGTGILGRRRKRSSQNLVVDRREEGEGRLRH